MNYRLLRLVGEQAVFPHRDFPVVQLGSDGREDFNSQQQRDAAIGAEVFAFWRYCRLRFRDQHRRDKLFPEFLNVLLRSEDYGDDFRKRDQEHALDWGLTWENFGRPDFPCANTNEEVLYLASVAYGACILGRDAEALAVLSRLTLDSDWPAKLGIENCCVLARHLFMVAAHSLSPRNHAAAMPIAASFSYYLSNQDSEDAQQTARWLDECLRMSAVGVQAQQLAGLLSQQSSDLHVKIDRMAADLEKNLARAEKAEPELVKKARGSLKVALHISDEHAQDERIQKVFRLALPGEVDFLKLKQLDSDSEAGDMSLPVLAYAKAAETLLHYYWDLLAAKLGRDASLSEHAASAVAALGKSLPNVWGDMAERVKVGASPKDSHPWRDLRFGEAGKGRIPNGAEMVSMVDQFIRHVAELKDMRRPPARTAKKLFQEYRNKYAHDSGIFVVRDALEAIAESRSLAAEVFKEVMPVFSGSAHR